MLSDCIRFERFVFYVHLMHLTLVSISGTSTGTIELLRCLVERCRTNREEKKKKKTSRAEGDKPEWRKKDGELHNMVHNPRRLFVMLISYYYIFSIIFFDGMPNRTHTKTNFGI